MVIRSRRGWTLVELMIMVAIVGVLASIAPSIISQTTKFFILSRTKLQLQEEARATMYLMTRELRQAQSGTITITQATGQPYYSQISFQKFGSAQTMTYTQNGSNLVLTNGTNITTLTTDLAYLAFTFPHSDDMTILSVSLTLQKQIYGGQFKALHMASERVRVMN